MFVFSIYILMWLVKDWQLKSNIESTCCYDRTIMGRLLDQREVPERDRHERFDDRLKRKYIECEIFVQAVLIVHGATSITSLPKV